MEFKKILVVYSEKDNESHLTCVKEVEKIVSERLVSIIPISDFSLNDLKNIDLVIVVGGDGSFIRVSHYLEDIPILGINSDPLSSVGAHLSLTSKQLSLLKNIFIGKFKIESLIRLSVLLNDKLLLEKSVNEIYVGAKNQHHTSRYFIELGSEREEQRSSGVLVVTNKGSGAWYKSAGGIEFFKDDIRYLVREPYVTKIFDSFLLSGRVKDKIKFVSTMNHEGVVVFDSNVLYDFNYGDTVVIKKSKFNLNVVKI